MTGWLAAFVIVLATYGFLVLFAYLNADSVLYQPRESSYSNGDRILPLQSTDGTAISTVFLETPGAKQTVLFLHGNACDLGDVFWLLEDMQRAGFSVAALDYRGYGTTPGAPNEKNIVEDTEALFRHLTEVRAIDPASIIVYGQSMGSGPATELARRHPVGGLVIEGGFTSAYRVVTRVSLLPGDRFRNLEKIDEIECPLLIIHGRLDSTVPFSHGKALYKAAREPKRALWIDDAGHNDLIEVAGERYWSALKEFAGLLSAR